MHSSYPGVYIYLNILRSINLRHLFLNSLFRSVWYLWISVSARALSVPLHAHCHWTFTDFFSGNPIKKGLNCRLAATRRLVKLQNRMDYICSGWLWNTRQQDSCTSTTLSTCPSSSHTRINCCSVVCRWQDGAHQNTNAGKFQLLMHTAHQPVLPISSWVHPSMTSEGRVDRDDVEIAGLFKHS